MQPCHLYWVLSSIWWISVTHMHCIIPNNTKMTLHLKAIRESVAEAFMKNDTHNPVKPITVINKGDWKIGLQRLSSKKNFISCILSNLDAISILITEFCKFPLSDTPNSGLGAPINDLMKWIRCTKQGWHPKCALLGFSRNLKTKNSIVSRSRKQSCHLQRIMWSSRAWKKTLD